MADMLSSAQELRDKLNKYVEVSEGEYSNVKKAKDSALELSSIIGGVNADLAKQWDALATVTSETVAAACSNLHDVEIALTKFIDETLENESEFNENVGDVNEELAEISDTISQLTGN